MAWLRIPKNPFATTDETDAIEAAQIRRSIPNGLVEARQIALAGLEKRLEDQKKRLDEIYTMMKILLARTDEAETQIQELKAQIDELKAQNTELGNTISSMAKKIDLLTKAPSWANGSSTRKPRHTTSRHPRGYRPGMTWKDMEGHFDRILQATS